MPVFVDNDVYCDGLFIYSYTIEDKGKLECRILDTVVTPRSTAVPRGHIHTEEEYVVVGFKRTEFCHIFGRLVEEYLRVVESARYKHIWIILCFDIVVRRI